MSKYGVLLAGAKRTHQQSHADMFAAHPDCELVAVASEKGDPEGRVAQYQELADDLGLPHIADLDEALARDDVHIVSSTPAVERRGVVAAKAMDAGKHVYLDKPMAGTVADLDMMVSAAERNGGVTQMFTQNLAGWVQDAKRAVQGGEIGELRAIHAENVFSKGRAGSVPKGTVRRESEELDRYTHLEAKREMFDVGIYSLGFIHEVTGGLGFESVLGHTGNYFFAEHMGAGVEDFGVMMATLEGGVNATVLGGRFGWMSHPLSGPQKVVVVGTEGTMRPMSSSTPSLSGSRFTTTSLISCSPRWTRTTRWAVWGASHPAYAPLPKQKWVSLGSRNVMADDVAAFVKAIDDGVQPDMNARSGGGADRGDPGRVHLRRPGRRGEPSTAPRLGGPHRRGR